MRIPIILVFAQRPLPGFLSHCILLSPVFHRYPRFPNLICTFLKGFANSRLTTCVLTPTGDNLHPILLKESVQRQLTFTPGSIVVR